jgi:hypothetical protein
MPIGDGPCTRSSGGVARLYHADIRLQGPEQDGPSSDGVLVDLLHDNHSPMGTTEHPFLSPVVDLT